jgi:multiple sugar transport system ATP-binding protein
MASITFTDVWKIYNRSVIAVRDLNLVIEDGEFLALLGPSGCGKTSTLRMVAGLEDISAGTIKIGDNVVNHLRPRERDIAMVFETYGLYPHLSVYDNIAFPLRVRNLNEAEIRNRVNKAAGIVDLGGTLDQFPISLGDGQKQRVSIARALVREPAVFLFDEPISHLDETLRRRMRVEIKHIQATLGTTMVYVTHDQIEAMAMADRIVLMDLGVVQQVGSPSDLYNIPANLFVASFIGEPPMNILPGELHSTDGIIEFHSNGFRLPITNPQMVQALKAHPRPQITMGIRPRHIDPHPQPGSKTVAAELYGFEPHGEHNILSFKIGNEVVLVLSGPGFFPEPGQTIHLEFTDNLHFFDIETGQSVLHGGEGATNG